MWLSHGAQEADLSPPMSSLFSIINHRTTLTWLEWNITAATRAVIGHHMKNHAQHAFVSFLRKHIIGLRTLKDYLELEMMQINRPHWFRDLLRFSSNTARPDELHPTWVAFSECFILV